MVQRPDNLRGADDDDALWRASLGPHVGPLISYVSRLVPANLQRVVDPQDIAQDALFQAVRALDRRALTDSDGVWRWLATVARNRLTDVMRERQSLKRGGGGRVNELDQLAAAHSSVIDLLSELAVHERTPSKSAVRRELLVTLERSMKRIDPAYGEAVRLRYVEGLSLKEAATRMSRSEDSTQKLCERGLRALRVQLRSMSLHL
jgi:RNA polymerase sigma-70 factor (ECF subfamily)